MVGLRRKKLAMSRRRLGDDGEDEEGSVVPGLEDDSLSEGSAISDADEDADGEGSDISDTETRDIVSRKGKLLANGRSEVSLDEQQPLDTAAKTSSFAARTNDTAAMMNGLKLSRDVDEAEEIHFDDIAKGSQLETKATASEQNLTKVTTSTTQSDKRRIEHEEYKKKRDADPAFVPNRGGFFMHDYRSSVPGQNGFRPMGRGRGRGRGAVGGPAASNEYDISERSILQSVLTYVKVGGPVSRTDGCALGTRLT